MNADLQDFKYKEVSDKIINIFYKVYNKLGYGFLEKIYENAMALNLGSKEKHLITEEKEICGHPGNLRPL